jgi:hypothetical protein
MEAGPIEASQPSRSDSVRPLTSRSPNFGKKCFSRRPLVSAAVRRFFAVSHCKHVSAATRTVGGWQHYRVPLSLRIEYVKEPAFLSPHRIPICAAFKWST